METKPILLFTKKCIADWCAHSLIFLGEMPSSQEIKFNGVPGFLDALHHLLPTPQTEHSPYQMILLTDIIQEHFYFRDKKIILSIQTQSLQIIDQDSQLNKENAYRILKHFMIKKKNQILFLVDGPNEKVGTVEKDLSSECSEQKKLGE